MRRLSEDVRRLGLDLAIAAGVNGVFLALSALGLWPLGKARLAGQLARGLAVLTFLIAIVVWVSAWIQERFRIESDPPSTAFVIMNLIVSGALQVGWSAYAALAVAGFTSGASFGAAAALHAVGVLSSFLSNVIVGAFYHGHLYKMANALLSVAGYIIVAVFAR